MTIALQFNHCEVAGVKYGGEGIRLHTDEDNAEHHHDTGIFGSPVLTLDERAYSLAGDESSVNGSHYVVWGVGVERRQELLCWARSKR